MTLAKIRITYQSCKKKIDNNQTKESNYTVTDKFKEQNENKTESINKEIDAEPLPSELTTRDNVP